MAEKGPETLAGSFAKLATQLQSPAQQPARPNNLTRSQTGQLAKPKPSKCDVISFGKSMAHLCAMKRTAQLTDLQIEAWYGVLGAFSAPVVNMAVVEMVLTETRFPELGDLYQICRRLAVKRGEIEQPYSPHGTGDSDTSRPTMAEIKAVAQRLGLDT